MFSRSICCLAESHTYGSIFKPALFQKNNIQSPNVYCRTQIVRAFRNSKSGERKSGFEPSPLDGLHIESGPLTAKTLIKPLLFTIGVCSISITGCVIWEYENLRVHASSFLKKHSNWVSSQQKKIWSHKSEPDSLRKWWNSLRDSEKVFYPILAANLLVFGAWRIRALQPIMINYFCSNPAGKSKCLPMILSTFSHYSLWHLAANMYVLYSFMPAAVSALGKEQFVALYLSAGVVSSFASFMYKVMMSQPGLSLGASGAIMSVLSYVCVQYPDTRLSIIFLPMYTFAAGTAIKVIMSVDLAGVIFGWRFFDHAAHLGGAIFGLSWCYWGSSNIWGNREKIIQYYHQVRKNDPGR